MLTVVFVAGAVVCIALLVHPRLGWSLERWRYRNGQAVEPSETWLMLRRLGAGVTLCVLLALLALQARDLVEEHRIPEDTAVTEEGFDRVAGERALVLGAVDGEEYGILGSEDRASDSASLVVAVPPCYGEPVVETQESSNITARMVIVSVGVPYLGGSCDGGEETTQVDIEHGERSTVILQDPDREPIPSCSSADQDRCP